MMGLKVNVSHRLFHGTNRRRCIDAPLLARLDLVFQPKWLSSSKMGHGLILQVPSRLVIPLCTGLPPLHPELSPRLIHSL
jgi:hypothetical protein